LAQAIVVLACAQQDAMWHRNRIANELRSLLREFYPTFLTAFAHRTDGLSAPMARHILLNALTEAAGHAFATHPDYQVITSFPGLADVSGARVLAEIGVDRTCLTDARALKAYAGSAPITRASGRSRTVVCRRVKIADLPLWPDRIGRDSRV
jgi:transposase